MNLGSFHVVVVQRRQRNVQKNCAVLAKLFCCFFAVLVAVVVMVVVASAPYLCNNYLISKIYLQFALLFLVLFFIHKDNIVGILGTCSAF